METRSPLSYIFDVDKIGSDGFRWFQFYWQMLNARNNSNYNKTKQSQLCIEWNGSGNIIIIIVITGCWLVAAVEPSELDAFVKSLENEVV